MTLPASAKGDQCGFLFHQDRCSGCKTCEVACNDYHGLCNETALRTIWEYVGGSWDCDDDGTWRQDVFCYHISISCNHCSDPVCMRFCPSDALVKGEYGLVELDSLLCSRCQTCMLVCPYHSPRFDEASGSMVKCDGCKSRVEQGLDPICIEACPQRALELVPFSRITEGPDFVRAIAPLPPSSLSQPNIAIHPSPVARPVGSREGRIANLREA